MPGDQTGSVAQGDWTPVYCKPSAGVVQADVYAQAHAQRLHLCSSKLEQSGLTFAQGGSVVPLLPAMG